MRDADDSGLAIGAGEVIALCEAIERGLAVPHTTAILREVLLWVRTQRPAEAAKVAAQPGVVAVPTPAWRPAVPKAKAVTAPSRREAPVRGHWTAEEDARMAALRRDGRTISEIAGILGRSEQACSVRFYTVVKPRLAEAGAVVSADPVPATAPAPPATPVTPPAPVTSAGVAPPFDPSVPSWHRAIAAHLDALGYRGPWSAALDLELTDAALQGRVALDDLSEERGIAREAMVARFRALSESGRDRAGPLSLEFQTRLRAVLAFRARGAQPAVEAAE